MSIENRELKYLNYKIDHTSDKNPYKLKLIKERLSWLSAKDRGNFIIKEDINIIQPLILNIINKYLYYRGIGTYVEKVLSILNEDIDNKRLIYRSRKGIKGVIYNRVMDIIYDINPLGYKP